MTDVTLHGPPQSTFLRAARMALEEKGVAYGLVPVEFKQPSHFGLHPFGRVPILSHGDFRLYETTAIMDYVDGAFDGPPLSPAEPAARARMAQWVSAVACYFDKDVTRAYILEYVFPTGDAPDRAKIDAALVDVRHHFGLADAALADQPYLAGGAISLADLILVPVVFYVSRMPEGEALMAENPNLARWLAAMADRSSFAATMPPPPPERDAG